MDSSEVVLQSPHLPSKSIAGRREAKSIINLRNLPADAQDALKSFDPDNNGIVDGTELQRAAKLYHVRLILPCTVYLDFSLEIDRQDPLGRVTCCTRRGPAAPSTANQSLGVHLIQEYKNQTKLLKRAFTILFVLFILMIGAVFALSFAAAVGGPFNVV